MEIIQKEKDQWTKLIKKASKPPRDKLASSLLGKSPKGTVRRSIFEFGKSQGWWEEG